MNKIFLTTDNLGSAIADDSVKREEFESLSTDVKNLQLTKMKNPTMYVFVNKSLKMSAGKVAAQVLHAQEELTWSILMSSKEKQEEYKKLLNQNPRTVIILETQDTEELYKINAYLESCELHTGIYVDEKGENYLLEPTALAVEYVDKTDPRMQLIFDNFPLYKDDVREKELLSDIKYLYLANCETLFNSRIMNCLEDFYKRETGKDIRELNDD